MKLTTQRQNIRDYIALCKKDVPPSVRGGAFQDHYWDRRKRCSLLDPETATCEDIEAIVGHVGGFGWHRLYACDECSETGDLLVNLTNHAEYDMDEVNLDLCPTCLRKALSLTEL